MKNEEKILRNWNVLWTGLAIVLSLGVIMFGITYNFLGSDNMGWGAIEITTETNRIYNVVDINIHTNSASSIYAHIFAGFFAFVVIQLLHYPIWNFRKQLVE